MTRVVPLLQDGPHASLQHADRTAWLLATTKHGWVDHLLHGAVCRVLHGECEHETTTCRSDKSNRAECWLQLLGCIAPGEDAAAVRARAEQQYNKLREQVALLAESPPPAWAEVQRQLAVDIPRASQDLQVFAGHAREAGLERLRHVLEALCLAELQELGYWQGYTDLAAPFIHVFINDWEAWWAMRALIGGRLRRAFAAKTALEAVGEDLETAARVLEQNDAILYRHLARAAAKLGHGPTQCAFQSTFLLFTRDLPAEQLLLLWECMWAWEAVEAGAQHTRHKASGQSGQVQQAAPPSLRPYGVAALLIQHREQLLKCRSIEYVIQFLNHMPALSSEAVVVMAAHAHDMWLGI